MFQYWLAPNLAGCEGSRSHPRSHASPTFSSRTTRSLVTMLEEASPLLGGQQKATPRWVSIYWLSTVVFCLSAAGFILTVPLTQLIEDNICSRYAQQGTPTERDCKNDDIQSKLAYLNGNLSLVEAVVGIDRPGIDICMKISADSLLKVFLLHFHLVSWPIGESDIRIHL